MSQGKYVEASWDVFSSLFTFITFSWTALRNSPHSVWAGFGFLPLILNFPQATPQTFPHHFFLPCTIFFAWLTSKPLFCQMVSHRIDKPFFLSTHWTTSPSLSYFPFFLYSQTIGDYSHKSFHALLLQNPCIWYSIYSPYTQETLRSPIRRTLILDLSSFSIPVSYFPTLKQAQRGPHAALSHIQVRT